jgi:hypothetical protein
MQLCVEHLPGTCKAGFRPQLMERVWRDEVEASLFKAACPVPRVQWALSNYWMVNE